MEKIPVGILGATGMVGQRFIQLLDNHPWFEIAELAASERSAGRSYAGAVEGRWKISADIPEAVKDMKVKLCKPNLDCKLVFSALDSSVAGPIEEEFAGAGYIVASNAKNHRMDPDVPLIIPEVNPEHLEIVKQQKTKGFIVTNPNCSTIGLVLALAPLHKQFGIDKVCVTTMQALSGAGYPGVASLDIIDNVIPFIGGEEGKMESEPLKILGSIKNNQFVNADISISAQCNRVHTKDGHLETVNLSLSKKVRLDDVKECINNFNPLKDLKLPTAPNPPIIIREEEDRPQPRLDRDAGKGMAVVVGRVRECPILGYRMLVLSHNTIRGAAGASVLNAELMKAKGFI
jgi:aspartate-semialdehyde dehydrogenase